MPASQPASHSLASHAGDAAAWAASRLAPLLARRTTSRPSLLPPLHLTTPIARRAPTHPARLQDARETSSPSLLPPLHLNELLRTAGGAPLRFRLPAASPAAAAAAAAPARLADPWPPPALHRYAATPHTSAWLLCAMCAFARVTLSPMLGLEAAGDPIVFAAAEAMVRAEAALRPGGSVAVDTAALSFEALRALVPPLLPEELRTAFLAGVDLLRGSLLANDLWVSGGEGKERERVWSGGVKAGAGVTC